MSGTGGGGGIIIPHAVEPLKDFASRLEAFFESAKDEVVEFAESFLPKLGDALEVALEDLAVIAGKAVLAQASQVISGQEKFGAAVTHVVQQVEAQGKTIAIGTAQTAVQSAYLTAQQIAIQYKSS